MLSDSGLYYELRTFNTLNDWFLEDKSNSLLIPGHESLSKINQQLYNNTLDVKYFKLRTNMSTEFHSKASGPPDIDNEMVVPVQAGLQES